MTAELLNQIEAALAAGRLAHMKLGDEAGARQCADAYYALIHEREREKEGVGA